MKTAAEYLDALMALKNITSDYQLAKALSVTRSTVSRYRCGHATFDDVVAVRVAEMLGVEPLEIIAAANHQRAKRPEAKKIWERIAKSAAAATIALVFVGISLFGGSPANAASRQFFSAGNMYYTKLRRWIVRLFMALDPCRFNYCNRPRLILGSVTMKGFLLTMVAVSLIACGRSDQQNPDTNANNLIAENYGYGFQFDAITPSGLRLRYAPGVPSVLPLNDAQTRAALMDSDFSDAEACTHLNGPPPLIIVIPDAGSPDTVNGITYNDTNTIVIEDTATMPAFEWVLRHEFIHALLAANGFPDDQNAAHNSPLFTTCALY